MLSILFDISYCIHFDSLFRKQALSRIINVELDGTNQFICINISITLFIWQIFTKPHPSRIVHKSSASKDTTGANHITPFFLKLDKLKPSVQPLKGTELLTRFVALTEKHAALWFRNTLI